MDLSDPHRFERVRDVLAELLDTPVERRIARLNELAGSDPPLRAAVMELLTLSEAADRAGFLDTQSGEQGEPPSAAERDPLPERIGPYQVLARLGEGGSGVVYLAESPAPMRRRVAIKLARASVRGQAAYRADIEAEALASFNHPGIAHVFETGVLEDGRRWTACELVDGEWITRSRLGEWRARVELLAQAAEAVHHAHQRGVIHRDLKPSNLMVLHEEMPPRLKVIDFGVARLLSPRVGSEAATEPGLLVGTLAYMSPEQLGGREVDARTDVYGLGLVACEVLTGEPPPGRSRGLTELTRASQAPVRVRLTDCDGYERDLEAVIAKATAPDAGARYPSMQHLADDLRRVLASEPVAARRADAMWRLRLYATRHPWFFTVTTTACVVIAALLAALSVSRARLAHEVLDQREMVSELVNDTLSSLTHIRGTIEQREAMVDALFDRHARRLKEDPNDPDLRLLHARLLRERGDIAASLGRHDVALSDLAISRDIYRSLSEERFGGAELGRRYAESWVRIGDVILERDRASGVREAMELYRQAMAVQEGLLRSNPGNIDLRDDLCWSYDRIGDLGDKWGAIPDAELEAWLRERVTLSESLLAQDPDRPHSLYNLATGQLRLARFLGTRERNDESGAAVSVALPYIREALRAEPDRTMFIQILIGALSWEARTLNRLGQHGALSRTISEMVDVARSQARTQPGDVMAEGQLLSALMQAAYILAEIGRSEEARAYADDALAQLDELRSLVSPSRQAELDAEEALIRQLLKVEP